MNKDSGLKDQVFCCVIVAAECLESMTECM